jgi:hypothetical protein
MWREFWAMTLWEKVVTVIYSLMFLALILVCGLIYLEGQ